jgi:hypothetical protein
MDVIALNHASQQLVPEHYTEIKERSERQADKIHAAVRERLVKEISYQQDRYLKLKADVEAGKQPRVAPEQFRRKAEELTARLQQRERELAAMKNVVSSTPVIIGGALIIPQGLLSHRKGETQFAVDAAARARVERVAMNAVIETEQGLGFSVHDVSAEKCGWDITSRPPPPLSKNDPIRSDRHIEVKGRAKGQTTITVSRNEIIYALNQAEKFLLAVVIVDGSDHNGPFYIPNPFTHEPDFGVSSINYDLKDLLSKSVTPEQTLR